VELTEAAYPVIDAFLADVGAGVDGSGALAELMMDPWRTYNASTMSASPWRTSTR
jgi:hypothetical protein